MTGQRSCPECGATVPVLSGYPDWCDGCGWGLKPPPTLDLPAGRFGQLERSLGRRSGERMARELLAAEELRPRLTAAKLAAYAVAAAVHLLTIALAFGGIAAIALEYTNPISILIGLAMLGVAFVIRPRVDRLEADAGQPLDPARAPTIHALVADVAAALDRPPPDQIVISAELNATWAVVDLKRRRVLILGMPLLAILGPGERVALIAHEIGHDRNGDARRGLLIGSAVLGLDRLSALLQPSESRDSIEAAVNALLWLVSRPVDAVLWLEARLLMRDSQRAEYLADALAARVAGSEATIALHERLLLWPTVALTVQHASHENATDVLDRLHAAVERVPGRERERRRRVARLEHTQLDDSHPPTGMRIALVEGRRREQPRVHLGEARSQMIDAELEPFAARVDQELLDAHRSSLYYG
jgi:Zn-dependent protease with chaperone function